MQRIRKAGDMFEVDITALNHPTSRKAGEVHSSNPEACQNIAKTAIDGVDYVRHKGVTDFNLAETYHLNAQLERQDTSEPYEDPQYHSSEDT